MLDYETLVEAFRAYETQMEVLRDLIELRLTDDEIMISENPAEQTIFLEEWTSAAHAALQSLHRKDK